MVFSLCTFFPVLVSALTTHRLSQFQFFTLWSFRIIAEKPATRKAQFPSQLLLPGHATKCQWFPIRQQDHQRPQCLESG